MDDAVELGDDGERAVGRRLRRRSSGAQEEESREDDSPHEEIVCGSAYGVRPRTPAHRRDGRRVRAVAAKLILRLARKLLGARAFALV